MRLTSYPILFVLCLYLVEAMASEEVRPGYNTPIPQNILTPERVETSIGVLEFQDGRPSPETSEKLYNHLDFIRGTEVFLNLIPMASLQALYLGHQSVGVDAVNKVGVMTQLMDSTPLFLTGNTDTVYASSFLDLKETGPVVVEIPAGIGPSTINDAFFRFVVDMGVPGLDKGKGGRYLILPPDYQGELAPPEGGYTAKVDGTEYFVAKTTSYVNWLIARGFLVDGKTDTAVETYKKGLRIYPYAERKSPPKMEFVSLSGLPFNTIHANNYDFYAEINEVIQREPISMLDPELRGLAASIGIEKGVPFRPDDRMKKILTDAVAVGNGTARAIMFDNRYPSARVYNDRQWYSAFVGGNYQWLRGPNGEGGRNLDARTVFFYQATVNTPAMVLKIPGAGSQYAAAYRDSTGEFFDGGRYYKLTLPKDMPAKDFWSVVVYDPQTRSELQTGQRFPSKNNKRDELKLNTDGSVDLYFGPKAPKDFHENWIQTVPGKGWFSILRLYGPTEAWFEKKWKPGDFEPVVVE
ncbi:hypothetical protein Mag101_08445 [Microbulbifer agarilyticus]|uniref:DUF1254 domain-containing protein n=1 Tax=Microbulbifer agarilyticus TaxID=260552 RepID=A0A1Q2M617_9GAMM|nr:DUF1254 domain-containing protein [Microbulbifer agarilyticus]AQQ67662.1 hypothetical protein Mag101_08445 [Microbulbifer agarilyticus]